MAFRQDARSFVGALLVIVLFIVVLELLFSFRSLPARLQHAQAPAAWLNKIERENAQRRKLFYTEQDPLDFPDPQKWTKAPELWRIKGGPKDTLDEYLRLLNNATSTEIDQIQKRCEAFPTQVSQMSDHQCRAEWRRQLKQDEIVGVKDMLGFIGHHKLSAFRVQFKSGRFGWYKACGYGTEMPENEIISYMMDEILQINRAAPAVMRNITTDFLEQLVKKQFGVTDYRLTVVDQLISKCSFDGVFMGAMVGWWYNIVPSETIPKVQGVLGRDFLSSEEIHEMRETIEPSWAAQFVPNHAFLYLSGTMRKLAYNEHMVKGEDGQQNQLVAIDLDRMTLTPSADYTAEHLTICDFCKFPTRMYQTYKKLNTLPAHQQFGTMVQYALAYDQPDPIKIGRNEKARFSTRIRTLTACMDDCVYRYSMDRVIIPNDVK